MDTEISINQVDEQTTAEINDAEPVKKRATRARTKASPEEEAEKRPVPKKIDPSMVVTVRNGFHGKLFYQSKKTGEKYKWSQFGEEQDMELSELRNARSSNKKFFERNWFMFDEAWIPEYLGVSQYYKYAIPINSFDDIFKKSADEMRELLSNLSDGQKKSVGYRARQLIAEEKIDSNKMIKTLEECLGIELVERWA